MPVQLGSSDGVVAKTVITYEVDPTSIEVNLYKSPIHPDPLGDYTGYFSGEQGQYALPGLKFESSACYYSLDREWYPIGGQ